MGFAALAALTVAEDPQSFLDHPRRPNHWEAWKLEDALGGNMEMDDKTSLTPCEGSAASSAPNPEPARLHMNTPVTPYDGWRPGFSPLYSALIFPYVGIQVYLNHSGID